MSLQPTQLNGEQAQTVYAVVNMQQAAQAADKRVQQAADEIIRKQEEALSQSEATNKTLAARLCLAMDRIEALAKRVDEIEKLRGAEKTASNEQIKALEMRLKSDEDVIKKLRTDLDTAKVNYVYHIRLTSKIIYAAVFSVIASPLGECRV